MIKDKCSYTVGGVHTLSVHTVLEVFIHCSYTVHTLHIHSGARPRSVMNLVDGVLHFAGRDCPFRVRLLVLAKKKCGKRNEGVFQIIW